MKKVLLIVTLLLLVSMQVGSFVFLYLKLGKIEEKVVALEGVVAELPQPMDPKNNNGQLSQDVGNVNTNTTVSSDIKTITNGNTNGAELKNQPVQPGENLPAGENPLANHDTFLTTSDDPKALTASDTAIFEGASVPEVVQLANGDLLLYFVDAESLDKPGTEQIGYSKSVDGGATWSEKEHVVFSGKLNEGPAVDPSLVQLEDGTLRMYFYGPDGPISDLSADTSEHHVYSAVSEDGINFAVEEGIRFSAQKLTDPEVIWHQGRWIMYVSLITSTGIATSDDGLAWTDTEIVWDGGGVPGAYVDADDVVHLYGCNPQGLLTASSTDGVEFTAEPVQAFSATVLGVCDPSPVLVEDGTMIMVYKQIVNE